MNTPDTTGLPDYAPIPRSALGPALNEQGYYVGHMGRLGTRDDVTLHQQYMADIAESSRKALDSVDLTPYFVTAALERGSRAPVRPGRTRPDRNRTPARAAHERARRHRG